MEKARLDRINWLLEITERECNHELPLSVKNMWELGACSFPFIMHVLPCLLPAELIKGKRFVLTDRLKLIPGSSSQEDSTLEPFVRLDCLPLSV